MITFQSLQLYRVTHLLRERIMLTPNLKLRLAVSLPPDPGHQRNLKFDVNIFLSRSRWATLYTVVRNCLILFSNISISRYPLYTYLCAIKEGRAAVYSQSGKFSENNGFFFLRSSELFKIYD